MSGSVTRPIRRPPVDFEYQRLIDSGLLTLLPTVHPKSIGALRRTFTSPPIAQIVGDRRIHCESQVVEASGLPVTVIMPADGQQIRGCVFAIHGGGLIVGDRHTGIEFTFGWVERFGLAIVSPEYRLAPENPYPAGLTDCIDALKWTIELVRDRWSPQLPLVMSGVSAGGALAAAIAIILRDQHSDLLDGLLLQGPMLDHRNSSTSSMQFSDSGQWDQASNSTGWEAYIGSLAHADVTEYVSPALADDLSGFPPTFVDVGSAEVFRDEAVAFATALWASGVEAQLNVWPGGVHGFDRIAPETTLGLWANQVRSNWLQRTIESHSRREHTQ